MTMGKLPTIKKLNAAVANLQDLNAVFNTVVKKISVEMIGANKESIIVIEREL